MDYPAARGDPRRELGVSGARPAPNVPRLLVEDHDLKVGPGDNAALDHTVDVPLTPQSLDGHGAPGQNISYEKTEPTIQSDVINRGLAETRKLLSHLLTRLENREEPPDLLEGAVGSRTARLHTHNRTRSRRFGQKLGSVPAGGHGGFSEDDASSDDEPGEWDNGKVYDLVDQLRSLLLLADRQGLELLGQYGTDDSSEPKHRKGKTGRLSSLMSPASPDSSQKRIADLQRSRSQQNASLFDRILSILRTLLTLDAAYSIKRFGPLRPPHALQVLCLDIATCIERRADVVSKIKIIDCIVDCFCTQQGGVVDRICAWLEPRLTDDYEHAPIDDTSDAKAARTLRISAGSKLLMHVASHLGTDRLSTAQGLDRLIRATLRAVPEASSMVLDVMAHGPLKHRNLLMGVFGTYFLDTIGHNVIALPVPDVSYGGLRAHIETETSRHNYTSLRVDRVNSSAVALPSYTTAISSLLSDVDLSSNELGMRLLVDRSSFTTYPEEALYDLIGAATRWVLLRDQHLHLVVQRYAQGRRIPPGVKLSRRADESPVQAYKDAQARLLTDYVKPWLDAFRASPSYPSIVYDQCKSFPWTISCAAEEHGGSEIARVTLENIAVLLEARLIDEHLVTLLTAWLEDVGISLTTQLDRRTITRLSKSPSSSRPLLAEMWIKLSLAGGGEPDDYARACRWTRTLATSGLAVPSSTLSELIGALNVSNHWASTDLIVALQHDTGKPDAQESADLAMQLCIKLARCGDTSHVVAAWGLVLSRFGYMPDVNGCRRPDRPGRQGMLSKGRERSRTTTPLQVKAELIVSIAYLLKSDSDLEQDLLDGLLFLLGPDSLAMNANDLLHECCENLYHSIWPRVNELAARRSRDSLLLRLSGISSRTLRILMIEEQRDIEPRETLLRIVLNIPDLITPQTPWFIGAFAILSLFMETESRENRSGQGLASLLSPGQLHNLSRLLEMSVLQESNRERLELLHAMLQYRTSLSDWQMLSWTCVNQLFNELNHTINDLANSSTAPALVERSDAQSIRTMLCSLALSMMATTATELPAGLVHNILQAIPRMAGSAHNAKPDVLLSLRETLDSSSRYIDSTSSGHQSKLLVGAPFVPPTVEMITEIEAFESVPTQRLVLDLAMTLITKHIVTGHELAVLGALQSIAKHVMSSPSSQNRLLAVQTLQVALDRCDRELVARVIPMVFGSLARSLVTEIECDGDAALMDEIQSFLRKVLEKFASLRFFLGVYNEGKGKRDILGLAFASLDRSTIDVPSVFNVPLSIMTDVLKRDRGTVDLFLRSTSSLMASLSRALTEDTATSVGAFVSRLGKHVAEWPSSEFDPNPILGMCTRLHEHFPEEHRAVFSHQIASFLHLSLTRFAVTAQTIASASSSLPDRDNTVRTVLFEISGAALQGLRIPPTTLSSLLDFLMEQFQGHASVQGILQSAAPGCVNILLRLHPTTHSVDLDPDSSVNIRLQAARLLLLAERAVPGVLYRQMSLKDVQLITLDSLTTLFIGTATCGHEVDQSSLSSLFALSARLVVTGIQVVTEYLQHQDLAGQGSETLSLSLSMIQAWCLVHHPTTGSSPALVSSWDRIWPAWCRLLDTSLDTRCRNGPLRALAQSSFADLAIFLITTDSPIICERLEPLVDTVKRLKISPAKASVRKLAQAAAALSLPLPSNRSNHRDSSIQAIIDNMIATERIRLLRMT